MLVGNKMDQDAMREVGKEEATDFCKMHRLFFIETSARDSSNVVGSFETLLKEIYRLISRKGVISDPQGTEPIEITVDNSIAPQQASKCCKS
jgi:Ras-related protein Rab-11A